MMSNTPHIYFSNRIETLYDKLKQELFGRSCLNPFVRRMIIVPSPAIKKWLMLTMAKDPDLKVAAGLEIVGIENVVDKLVVKRKIPSFLELALSLEVEIKAHVLSSQDPVWLPLKKYLKVTGSSFVLSRKGERRLVSLSLKLARLFLRYGTYGLKMVKEWEENASSNWQAILWNNIYKAKEWSFLAKEMELAELPTEALENREIHLFSISFLSKHHFGFFERISKVIPVTFYHLSPCQAFWSDLCSDRQLVNLRAHWQKRGIVKLQQMELDDYLRDRNPLLANFGMMGREMAKLIEESGALTEADYSINCHIPSLADYESLIFDECHEFPGKLSLLNAIQADMVLLRTPDESKKVELEDNDDSVQIHSTPSKMREIEALYHTLMQLIQKNLDKQEAITPADIIVMAPDIMVYEPYIRAVFGSSESLMDFHILDLQILSQNSLIRGFIRLLNLSASRWDAISLMQLFDEPDFRNAQGLKEEDVLEIKEWLVKAHVRWGNDAAHRDELLVRDHCYSGMIEKSDVGTFEGGIRRLISGLVMVAGLNPEQSLNLPTQPIQALDTTDSELFGKLITLIRSLQADLQILSSGTKLNLKQWALYLKCLAETYFGVVRKSVNSEGEQTLLDAIDRIRRCSFSFKEDTFSFITIKQHLESSLDALKIGNRESHLNSVRFCSMLPMRAVPAKILALVGMNENEFPRSQPKDSLDLLANYPDKDYNPSQIDYDRYLFLEALLSCRQYLLMFYVDFSASDNQAQAPSIVVTELLSYIKKAFSFGSKTFEEISLYHHPFHGFDATYFEENSSLPNYSKSLYRKAEAFYAPFKESKHRFFDSFKKQEITEFHESEITVDIKALTQFAKNPFKTYFNHSLEWYIRDEEEEIKSEEDLTLSYIEHDRLKKATLKHSLTEVINLADLQGVLPMGSFKDLAINKLKMDVDDLHHHLMVLGIKPKELFAIHFVEETQVPSYNQNGDLELPPLRVKFKDNITVTLIGTLPEVSHKGLVVHGKDEPADVIRAWPHFLILLIAKKQFGIAVESAMLMLKSGEAKVAWFENAEELFVEYLGYFFEGQKNINPLIPEWIKDFVTSEHGQIQGKIEASLNNAYKPIFNEYLKWVARDTNLHSCESFSLEWPLKAKEIYGNLLTYWFPQRKGKEED